MNQRQKKLYKYRATTQRNCLHPKDSFSLTSDSIRIELKKVLYRSFESTCFLSNLKTIFILLKKYVSVARDEKLFISYKMADNISQCVTHPIVTPNSFLIPMLCYIYTGTNNQNRWNALLFFSSVIYLILRPTARQILHILVAKLITNFTDFLFLFLYIFVPISGPVCIKIDVGEMFVMNIWTMSIPNLPNFAAIIPKTNRFQTTLINNIPSSKFQR